MGLCALRGRNLFRRILSSGYRRGSRGVVVYWQHNGLEHNRYGIAVRRTVGGAVRRNRIRRWTREYLRDGRHGLVSGVDIVILVNRDERLGNYKEYTDHLSHVLDLSYLTSSQPAPALGPGGPDGTYRPLPGAADDPRD
ncbi:ribonuclease P protein component [bacterium]|nr:ribonuclease P protein component [bacterium]